MSEAEEQKENKEDILKKEKDRLRRKEAQKLRQLRAMAITLAEEEHGTEHDILARKNAVTDAEGTLIKAREKMRALSVKRDKAVSLYEKALEKHINPKYKLSKDEWERRLA